MPPLLIPSLARFAIGVLGAGAAVHWFVKEVRRINEELDRVKRATTVDANTRSTFPTLRRDPHSGEWRVS